MNRIVLNDFEITKYLKNELSIKDSFKNELDLVESLFRRNNSDTKNYRKETKQTFKQIDFFQWFNSIGDQKFNCEVKVKSFF